MTAADKNNRIENTPPVYDFRHGIVFRLKAEELFLGEGKPSTSEAGFSLSQTLTLSQHGLGVHPKTPKIVADRLSYLVTHEFVEQDFLSAPDSTPSETSDGFPQSGKRVQIAFEVSAQVGKRHQMAFEVFPQFGEWYQIAFEMFPQFGKRHQIAFEVFPQVGKWYQMAFEVFPQFRKRHQIAFEVSAQVRKRVQIVFEVSAQVGKWVQIAFDTFAQGRGFERSGVLGCNPKRCWKREGVWGRERPRFRVEVSLSPKAFPRFQAVKRRTA